MVTVITISKFLNFMTENTVQILRNILNDNSTCSVSKEEILTSYCELYSSYIVLYFVQTCILCKYCESQK